MNRVYVENEQKINITTFDNNEQFFEHKQVVIEFYKRLHLNWIGPVIFNVMTSSFVSTIFWKKSGLGVRIVALAGYSFDLQLASEGKWANKFGHERQRMCRFFSLSSKQLFFRDQFFVWLLLFSVIFVKFDYTKKSQRIERKSLATYPSSVGGFFAAPSSNLQKGRWTKKR